MIFDQTLSNFGLTATFREKLRVHVHVSILISPATW